MKTHTKALILILLSFLAFSCDEGQKDSNNIVQSRNSNSNRYQFQGNTCFDLQTGQMVSTQLCQNQINNFNNNQADQYYYNQWGQCVDYFGYQAPNQSYCSGTGQQGTLVQCQYQTLQLQNGQYQYCNPGYTANGATNCSGLSGYINGQYVTCY